MEAPGLVFSPHTQTYPNTQAHTLHPEMHIYPHMLPLTPKHIPNRPSSHGIPLGAGISALRLGKGVRVLRVFRLIRVLKGGGILQDRPTGGRRRSAFHG